MWVCKIMAAAIMLQTLFFKFSAAPESVYIFSKVGIEPWGRLATGVAELIASTLILIPKTTIYGALLGAGIMGGALLTHIFILGIIVQDDGGQLFVYALLVLISCLYLIWISRDKLFSLLPFSK